LLLFLLEPGARRQSELRSLFYYDKLRNHTLLLETKNPEPCSPFTSLGLHSPTLIVSSTLANSKREPLRGIEILNLQLQNKLVSIIIYAAGGRRETKVSDSNKFCGIGSCGIWRCCQEHGRHFTQTNSPGGQKISKYNKNEGRNPGACRRRPPSRPTPFPYSEPIQHDSNKRKKEIATTKKELAAASRRGHRAASFGRRERKCGPSGQRLWTICNDISMYSDITAFSRCFWPQQITTLADPPR